VLVESIKLDTSDIVDDRVDARRVGEEVVKEEAVGSSAWAERKAFRISFMVLPPRRQHGKMRRSSVEICFGFRQR
jgi:hypothetical protein